MLWTPSPDWGDVPTWVASLVTSGALVLTALGLDNERKARREDVKDRQAAQARLVTCEARPAVLHGVVVAVTNHSDSPVFAVRVLGLAISPGTDGIVVAWSQTAGQPQRGEWTTVPPGQTVECSLVCFTADGSLYEFAPFDSLAVDIEYVDALGLRWERAGSHPPVRLTAQPLAVPDHAASRVDVQDDVPDPPRPVD